MPPVRIKKIILLLEHVQVVLLKTVEVVVLEMTNFNRYFLSLSVCFILLVSISFPPHSSISFASSKQFASEDPYLAMAQQVHGASAWKFVEQLVSEEYAGRLSGTKGADLASEWIANTFQSYGLNPGGNKENTTFFQPFQISVYEAHPPTSLSLIDKEQPINYRYRKDFSVMPFSGSGLIKSQLVFAGYGISEEDSDYDDFEDIDLRGKIALILRRAPTFDNFGNISHYFSKKIELAKKNGAIGILFTDSPHERSPYSMNMKPAHGTEGDFPIFYISHKVADTFLSKSSLSLSQIIEKINNQRSPFSFSLDCTIEMNTRIEFSYATTSNVIGYLPARAKTQDSMIVMAHYDHLGVDPIDKAHFAGANDNASGVGTLIEIARAMTHHCFTSDINIVFIAFSGEEQGLIGSFHYAKNPLFPLENIRAVFNMDMIGTGIGPLLAGTSQNSFPELYGAIKTSADSLELDIIFNRELLYGGSDHVPFFRQNVPSVFFFRSNPTGIGGYHNPDDTLDTIDPNNLEEAGRIVLLSMMLLSEPLFMIVDSVDWKKEIVSKPYLRIYGKGNFAFTVIINEKKLSNGNNARFFYLAPLENGQNLIHISFLMNEVIVYEKILTVRAKIQQESVADFNDDGQVNILDFAYFSQYFGKHTNALDEWAVCDLNSDGIIDEKDLNLFQRYYGYKGD